MPFFLFIFIHLFPAAFSWPFSNAHIYLDFLVVPQNDHVRLASGLQLGDQVKHFSHIRNRLVCNRNQDIAWSDA